MLYLRPIIWAVGVYVCVCVCMCVCVCVFNTKRELQNLFTIFYIISIFTFLHSENPGLKDTDYDKIEIPHNYSFVLSHITESQIIVPLLLQLQKIFLILHMFIFPSFLSVVLYLHCQCI